MFDLRNPLGLPEEDDDRTLKARIENVMKTDLNRYWRDQEMQDDYFGILQREEAARAPAQLAPLPADAARKAEIEDVMRRDRPRYHRTGMDKEYLGILQRELNPQPSAPSSPFAPAERPAAVARPWQPFTAESLSGTRLALTDPAKLTGITLQDDSAGNKDDRFSSDGLLKQADGLRLAPGTPVEKPQPLRVAQNAPRDETFGQSRDDQDALTRAVGNALGVSETATTKRPVVQPQMPEVKGEINKGEVNPLWDPRQGFFERRVKGTPLQGKWDVVREAARKNNIPPTLLAAVMAQESGWGKDTKGTKNNPGGLMVPKSKDQTEHMAFKTIDEGIEATARTVAKHWVRAGGDLKTMANTYAPPDAKNDTRHLNNKWFDGVRWIKNKFEQLTAPIPGVLAREDSSQSDAYALRSQRDPNERFPDNWSTWNSGDANLTKMRDMIEAERKLRDINKSSRPSWPRRR